MRGKQRPEDQRLFSTEMKRQIRKPKIIHGNFFLSSLTSSTTDHN